MRESDRKTIENHVPSLTLMYRAAMGVYRAATWRGDIAIAVGSGNNGGDGFTLAYILKSKGIGCRVVTLSDRLSPDSAHFAEKAKSLNVPVAPYTEGAFSGSDIIVDCLLGTGFHGAVREPYASAIREINAAGAYVVSVDINSGMNGDTGEAELAVRSDLTVTIGFVKNGMLAANAGDSNTYGYDPRSYFGSQYPADVRWTGLLQAAGWKVANCGQNGLCTPREPQFPAVADLLRRVTPDVVTVMLGSNDLLNGASAGEVAARMEALLRSMRKAAGDASILLIAPPPMRFGDWVQTQKLIDDSGRLGGLYRNLADKLGVGFTDAGKWGVALTFDGVHFSPEGHAAFAEGLIASLKGL